MPAAALPPHLRDRPHEDYPPGLRWVPRAWTAYQWGTPILWKGNLKNGSDFASFILRIPKPITAPGTWQLSRFPEAPWYARWYFAVTFRNGWHFRAGTRWDDVDHYDEWPAVAVKPPPKP